MLADPNKEIRQQTFSVLSEFRACSKSRVEGTCLAADDYAIRASLHVLTAACHEMSG